MLFEVWPVGLLQCNCSILGDEATQQAIIVDPGADIVHLMSRLSQNALTLAQIVVTHAHIDHIASALTLQRLTGAPILYNQADLPLVAMMDVQAGWLGIATPEVSKPDVSLEDGTALGIGETRAIALHTPGHTPGSMCVYLPQQSLLLAGDTLFAGSVGRTDLPGGDMTRLLRSIYHTLLPLPDETRVIPGHGSETTIGKEREHNSFLRDL